MFYILLILKYQRLYQLHKIKSKQYGHYIYTLYKVNINNVNFFTNFSKFELQFVLKIYIFYNSKKENKYVFLFKWYKLIYFLWDFVKNWLHIDKLANIKQCWSKFTFQFLLINKLILFVSVILWFEYMEQMYEPIPLPHVWISTKNVRIHKNRRR